MHIYSLVSSKQTQIILSKITPNCVLMLNKHWSFWCQLWKIRY